MEYYLKGDFQALKDMVSPLLLKHLQVRSSFSQSSSPPPSTISNAADVLVVVHALLQCGKIGLVIAFTWTDGISASLFLCKIGSCRMTASFWCKAAFQLVALSDWIESLRAVSFVC
jgi:hypothetical protein